MSRFPHRKRSISCPTEGCGPSIRTNPIKRITLGKGHKDSNVALNEEKQYRFTPIKRGTHASPSSNSLTCPGEDYSHLPSAITKTQCIPVTSTRRGDNDHPVLPRASASSRFLTCPDEDCSHVPLAILNPRKIQTISMDALMIGRDSRVITRKFALLPEPFSNRRAIYQEVKDRMVKARDLQNIYLTLMKNSFLSGALPLTSFAIKSMAHVRKEIYDTLNLSQVLANEFKSVQLKERMKRSCIQYPYHALRNWIIRNENLKVLAGALIQLFSAKRNLISRFLQGKTFSSGDMTILSRALQRDVFGNHQALSFFMISNMVGQLRNLFLSETRLSALLEHNLVQFKESLIQRKLAQSVLQGFTRKKKGVTIPLKLDEIIPYFLDRYFVRIKKSTRKRAKKTMSPSQFQQFKQQQDRELALQKQTVIQQLSRMDVRKETYDSVMRAIAGVVHELETTPNVDLSKHLFKPIFEATKVGNPSLVDYMTYLTKILRDGVKGKLKGFFITQSVADLLIIDLKYVGDNLYSLVNPPKLKKLSVPIAQQEQVYEMDPHDRRVKLSFEPRKFYTFKINDKKGIIPQLLREGAIPHVPVITMKGNKVIINLPFEVKRRALSKQTQEARKQRNIEIGVDLGLKHFAVLSVMDCTIPGAHREVARYFLGQKTIFDMKFDLRSGRFVKRARFHDLLCDKNSNQKNKLIALRSEIRNLQRKLHEYENRLTQRGVHCPGDKLKFNKLSQRLSGLWDRVHNCNLEIVRLLNHVIISIAEYHRASVIKFEDLRWARHEKKREKGKFMAFWQTHWFYSQVQEAVKLQAYLHSISFKLVDARYTSQRCSSCGRLVYINFRGEKVRNKKVGKRFTCQNFREHPNLSPFRLDSDLNAARNIALA